MTVSLYESLVYGPMFSDRTIVELFEDRRRITVMVDVEVALARAQAELGVIPPAHASEIASGARSFEPDMGTLGRETRLTGVPTIELVKQLRTAVGEEAARSLHLGATSQDIIDTAHVLMFRSALAHLDTQLDSLTELLATLADRHRHNVMPGRTRSQQAVPITFGLKVAGWLAPFIRHRARLDELTPRLLMVQFGGAAGTQAALGEDGIRVMEGLARELGLSAPVMPWHVQRDAFTELAGCLSMVSGSLGKIGQDIVLMSQTEVGEITESPGDEEAGSSTMPNKSNPIGSEMLVAAARMNASLLTNMHHAMIAEHERATHGWQLEWNTLPQMICCTCGALDRARTIIGCMRVNEQAMQHNVRDSSGLLLAEHAAVLLSTKKDRAEAQAQVRDACHRVRVEGGHLMDVLKEVEASIDWEAEKDAAGYLGMADAFVERVLGSLRRSRE